MKNLIRKILKENNDEWDWVSDIRPPLTMDDLLNPNYDISKIPKTSFKTSIGQKFIITYHNGKILIYDPERPIDYIDNGAYWDWDELRDIFINRDYGWVLGDSVITEGDDGFDWVRNTPELTIRELYDGDIVVFKFKNIEEIIYENRGCYTSKSIESLDGEKLKVVGNPFITTNEDIYCDITLYDDEFLKKEVYCVQVKPLTGIYNSSMLLTDREVEVIDIDTNERNLNEDNVFDWIKDIPGEIDWDSPSVPSNMVTISFRTDKGNGGLYQLIHSHDDVFYVVFFGGTLNDYRSMPWEWSRISQLFKSGRWVRVNTLKESEGEWDWVKDIPELSYDTLKSLDEITIRIPDKENFFQKFIGCDFTRDNLSNIVDFVNQGYPVVVLNVVDDFTGQDVYCNGDNDDLDLLSFELLLTVKDHLFLYGNSIEIWITQEDFEIVGYSSK